MRDDGSPDRPNPHQAEVIVSSVDAEPKSVRPAREQVADLAAEHGASEELVDDVRLAVSEAITNAVIHGYEPTETGKVHLLAAAGPTELIVSIEDDGRGLSAPTLKPGLGRGLHIIRQITDRVLFTERPSHGTSVQMRFTLARNAARRRHPKD